MTTLPQADPRSLMQALQRVKASGHPEPVLNEAGQVVYYVDTQGEAVDAKGAPYGQPDTVVDGSRGKSKPKAKPAAASTAGPPLAPYGMSGGALMDPFHRDPNAANRTSGDYSTENGGLLQGNLDRQGRAEAAKNTPQAKAADAAKAAAAAAATGQIEQLQSQFGQVWVDGKEAHVTGRDAKGNLLISVGDGKPAPMSTALGTLTAFNALNQTAINPDTQFVMSVGAQRRADGSVMTERGGAFSDSQVGSAPLQGQNRMTIGSALNFLASLSTKDKGAFQVVVDQLHKAGYLSDQDYVNSGSSYNAAIGTAYSRVALDVAALNSTEGGANTGLDTYLADRAAHPPKAALPKPVTRSYTDPNEIRAAAESAAMAAIGRRLTPQEQAAMTAHFHGQESSNYDAMDAANRAGTGATVTQPSVTGAAYAEINDNPQLAQEQSNFDMLKYGDMIKSLMGVR